MAQGREETAAERMGQRKRLTQDEIEEAVYQMREWMAHMQRVNPQFIMPHPTAPAIDEEGRANLNRAPAAHDTRRRD
jgi:mannitol/fructose-specific phosphotransferase system IIA component (Ntr-type)